MATKKISQRDARMYKHRAETLERLENSRRNAWVRDYPGGVNIAAISYGSGTDFIPAVIDNSRKLGHAVVAVSDGGIVKFYALPLGVR